MGSHSVTCHPTQANTPRLNPRHAGWYSIYLPQREGRLSWPTWLDSAPAGSRTSDLLITIPTPNRCTTKTAVSLICIFYPISSLDLIFRNVKVEGRYMASFVRWQMSRLVSDFVPVHLRHWLSAVPDCLPSVTELFRSPLLASGTGCLILSLPHLP